MQLGVFIGSCSEHATGYGHIAAGVGMSVWMGWMCCLVLSTVFPVLL